MIPTPPWLTPHDGKLQTAVDGRSVVVLLDGEPQYVVTPIPVAGKHGSQLKQTVNGRILPTTGTYATDDEAIRAGLEDLRQALGW